MKRLRSWLWPVPPALATATFVAVLAAALAQSWSQITALVADWAALSSAFHEGLAFAGPVAGLGSLWVAMRFNAPRGLLVPVASVRAGWSVVGRQVAVMLCVTATAFVAGLVPAIVDAAMRATWGGPDWLVIASFLPAMALYVALGCLLGTALPRVPAVAAGAGALFWLAVAGSMAGPRWWSVAPVWMTGASAGFYENPVMVAFRILFFTVTAACLAAAGANWLERRSAASLRHSAAGLAVLVLPAALVLVAGARPVHSIVRDLDAPSVCEHVDNVRVCVHAAHAPLLDGFLDLARGVLDAAGPDLTRGIDEILDSALSGDEDPPRRAIIGLPLYEGDGWRDYAALTLATYVGGLQSCEYPDADEDGGLDLAPDHPSRAAEILSQWIYQHSSHVDPDDTIAFDDAALGRLDALGAQGVHDWIARRSDAVLRCLVAYDELP